MGTLLDRVRGRRYPQPALLVLAAIPAALIIGFGAHFGEAVAAEAKTARFEREARATATEFFRALETRRFEAACDLLAEGFYRLNGIRSRKLCALGLRYGMSTRGITYRILAARAGSNRATVRVVADGVPGELVLVRDRGRFRVLSLGAR